MNSSNQVRPAPRRRALLLGCATFADPAFPTLYAAQHDVEALAQTLADPHGSQYEVTTRVNCVAQQAQLAIEQFFTSATPSDVHLLYLSCHGVQSPRGDLHFAFADTRRNLLGSTSVSAEWVRNQILASRSRTTIVLIDCCFSGAFIRGMQARSGIDVNVSALVRDLPEGTGVAVLTAAGETEFSFEDVGDERTAPTRPSYFTDAVVTGIRTGAADRNADGWITVDELYEYVYQRLVEGPSPQRPRRLGFGEGDVVIAKVAHRVPQPPRPPAPPLALPVVAGYAAVPRPPGRPEAASRAKGVLGSVSFDGQWICVAKNGFGPAMKGQHWLHITQVGRIELRLASRLYNGYIYFARHDRPPLRFRRNMFFGGPPMTDPDSVSFRRRANAAFAALYAEIGAVQNKPKGPGPVGAIGEVKRSTIWGNARAINDACAGEGSNWGWGGRIVLWVVTAMFAVMELGAIGVTVTNTWPDPAVQTAIIGNACYSIPLAALLAWVVFDVRRLRRRGEARRGSRGGVAH